MRSVRGGQGRARVRQVASPDLAGGFAMRAAKPPVKAATYMLCIRM
jgi:hypothetical protein